MLWLAALILSACAGPPAGDSARRAELDAVYERYDIGFPQVQPIDAAALMAALKSDAPPVLLDVRPAEERNVSILPGALSPAQFEARKAALKGRTVVTYCTVGVRSGFEANRLRKEGFDVKNFKGSILAWAHAGGDLVRPDGSPTKQVHVYGKSWNYAPSAYEAVITSNDGTVTVLEPAQPSP